ncbi:MAG: hypothetical protein IKX23_11195 [Treponema sp.]|nr:hypothetical protein [Treponema sp.]
MGKIKFYILSLLFILTGNLCFAKQISFQIVQKFENVENKVRHEDLIESTYIFEDELLDAFFSKGFIVTNSPSVNIDKENPEKSVIKAGLKDAKEGLSDYYVHISVVYNDDNSLLLEKVEWSVYNGKNGKKIKSGDIKTSRQINLLIDRSFVDITSEITDKVLKVIKA